MTTMILDAHRGAAPELSGLELLQAMGRGDVPVPPALAALEIEPGQVEPGRAVFALEPGEGHYDAADVVHGGVTAALLDTALGCAVHSLLPAGHGYTILDLKIHFVRTLRREVGKVACEGRVLHLGRTVATAEARVSDAAGRLYAHGTATCLLLPRSAGSTTVIPETREAMDAAAD